MTIYYTSYKLKSACKALDSYCKNRINLNGERNINIEIHKNKMLYNVTNIELYVNDIAKNVKTYDNDSEDIIARLNMYKEQIINATNNQQLINTKSNIIRMIKNASYDEMQDWRINEDMEKHNSNSIVELEYVPIKMDAISNCIKMDVDREINYLNPCIFCTLDDTLMPELFNEINMYGIIGTRLSEAENSIFNKDIYTRIIEDDDANINNSLAKRNLRISNNTFDIINIQPKISITPTFNKDNYLEPSYELTSLKDNYKYLRTGGVMFYTIPFTRFTPDIKLWLSKNFVGLDIIRNPKDTKDNVLIIGQKSLNKESEKTYDFLKNLKLDDITDKNKYIYTLPEKVKSIELFRGGKVSEKEIKHIIETDRSYDDFFKTINSDKILIDTKPLLPFNLGQVGLILTSGALDGIVEETNGIKHVIKGRTIKTRETLNNSLDENTQVTKIGNAVQINAFDAAGNFIVIT